VVAERVTVLLEARLRDRDSLKAERGQRFVSLARQLAENEDESALIAMLLDDYYQQSLHAPVLRPGEAPSPQPRPEPAARKKVGVRPRHRRGSSSRPARR
jgi:ATP-dependent RNA helicase DeaD